MRISLVLLSVFLTGLFSSACSNESSYNTTGNTSGTVITLPDTGAGDSFSGSFGEDADYQINSRSYTDNGDGTVTDNVTRLVWQQGDNGDTLLWENAQTYCEELKTGDSSDCFLTLSFFPLQTVAGTLNERGGGTVTDEGTGLLWQQGEGGTKTWEEALAYCESLTEGDTNWRLPNSIELSSLVDTSREQPALDTLFFPDVHLNIFFQNISTVSAQTLFPNDDV